MDLRYIGEDNVSIFAYDIFSQIINDSLNIIKRYSPYNRTFPPNVPGYRVIPTSLNVNATPFGQEINYCDNDNKTLGFCDNNSIPINTVESLAKTDPFDFMIKMPSIRDACVTVSFLDNITVEDSFIMNETYQKISRYINLSNSSEIYSWVEGNCTSTSLRRINLSLAYTAICSECVWPLDVGGTL